MGKEKNIMNSYLAVPERFAEFFNAVCFEGKDVICPEGLKDASEKYDIALAGNPETGENTGTEERIRDIKKLYSGGSVLRVLAMENQNYVDYTAGLRNMQYDAMEYTGQLKFLKAKHKYKDNVDPHAVLKPATSDEMLSGVSRSDMLHPAYTLWFYHGEAEWDGPRSLRDMMDFGDDSDGMSEFFHDTVEAMSIMLHMPEIWDNRENFMRINEEREEYDMCQGMREWLEEERNIGFNEGIEKGIESLVLTCKKLQCTKDDTKQQLMLMYEFDNEEEAAKKVDLYWK